MKKTWLFWTAVACVVVGVVLICIAVFLLVQRQPVVPFVPESPLPTPRPPSPIYLPLVARNHLRPIKHGLAGQGSCEQMQEVGARWYYNWSNQTTLECPVEFVPMIWSPASIGNEIPPGSKWLLGFNECGIEGQCNATPCEGAVAWREMEAEYPNVKLISPAALGWYGADWHLGWLIEMHDCYVVMYGEAPRFDAIAAHCYGSDEFCQAFLTDVIAYVDTIGGQPIWVTEFANAPTATTTYTQTLESMAVMVGWFEAHPRIERWSWFALTYRGDESWIPHSWVAPYTCLVDYDTHELTPCGELYRTLP